MKRVRIYIYGRVQGVLFRHYTNKKAINLGLKGYVRNIGDGSVEVVAEGDKEGIENLIKFCKKGPVNAIVKKIKIDYEEPKADFEEFGIRY